MFEDSVSGASNGDINHFKEKARGEGEDSY